MDVPRPTPISTELLVEVHAAGVNPVDWKTRRGRGVSKWAGEPPFGLRWDVEKGRTERFKQLSYFDFGAPSPIAQAVGIPTLRGGLKFVGVNGNPQRQRDNNQTASAEAGWDAVHS